MFILLFFVLVREKRDILLLSLIYQETGALGVFQALDGETPILGVLQRADTPLYARIANHPQVRLVEVTRENRDGLAHMPICLRQEGIACPGPKAKSRP